MIDHADKRWLTRPLQDTAPVMHESIAERAALIRAIWGPRMAIHPQSTFRYVPSNDTDIRVTLRRAGLEV